jgi:MFS family permease
MNKDRLFIASCMALIATAMSFAIRGDILGDFQKEYVEPMVAAADAPAAAVPEGGAAELIKTRLGLISTIWGFSFAILILIGGPLVDFLGMALLLRVAAICHIGGCLLTIFAPNYWTVVAATFIMGAGNGLVEAVCNPLIATIYPEERTHKLTVFHSWFPGGIAIGGILAYLFSQVGIGWQLKMATILVPSVIYAIMIMGQKFPATERVAAGISFSGMFTETLRRPLFWIIWVMMWLTAVTELVPGGWIPNIYQDVFNGPGGILAVVWGSILMFVLRAFFSKFVHQLSPPLLLTVTAPFAVVGLFLFKFAETPLLFFGACTLLYIGVCFWWPTMLGLTSERCPKTGALGLAIIGGTGSFAVSVFGPVMGYLNDNYSPREALQIWAVLPVVITLVFLAVYLKDRFSGGYKAEVLKTEE